MVSRFHSKYTASGIFEADLNPFFVDFCNYVSRLLLTVSLCGGNIPGGGNIGGGLGGSFGGTKK